MVAQVGKCLSNEGQTLEILAKPMQENIKKNKEKKASSPKCQLEECKFPKTCDWNQRCMQGELEVSMRGKESFQKKDHLEGEKEGR